MVALLFDRQRWTRSVDRFWRTLSGRVPRCVARGALPAVGRHRAGPSSILRARLSRRRASALQPALSGGSRGWPSYRRSPKSGPPHAILRRGGSSPSRQGQPGRPSAAPGAAAPGRSSPSDRFNTEFGSLRRHEDTVTQPVSATDRAAQGSGGRCGLRAFWCLLGRTKPEDGSSCDLCRCPSLGGLADQAETDQEVRGARTRI